MEQAGLLMILGLAFGLGLLHALDADHIVAVSGLAGTRPNRRTSLRFCMHWAIGHGLTLLSIGAVVLVLGMAVPVELSHVAESLIGVILILIGLWILWDLRRCRAHLHFHGHDGLLPHAHWHVHHSEDEWQRHDHHKEHHGAVLVGVLHGAAGSAPLLALIPITAIHSPWLGMTYLLVFGLGVLVTMAIFGGLIGIAFHRLARWGDMVIQRARSVVAVTSLAVGSFWLYGSL